MTRQIDLVDVLTALADIRAEQQQLGRQINRHIEMMGAAMGFAAAADYLGVSERTIARWVTAGRLRLVPHTDRRRLIARVELDRFAEGRRSLVDVSVDPTDRRSRWASYGRVVS